MTFDNRPMPDVGSPDLTTPERIEYREKGPTTRINLKQHERRISMLGGAALALAGAIKRGWVGLGLGLAGGGLLVRGATGQSMILRLLGQNRAVVDSSARVAVPHEQGVRVEDSVIIERGVGELYNFWRDFTHLAQFMPHVKSVEVYEGNRSHWVVEGPAGAPISWDAEIVNDIPNELIAWRTVSGSVVDHAGSVRFDATPDGGATLVRVVFEYAPAGGAVGASVARMFGRAPEQQVPDALQHLKELMEGRAGSQRDGEAADEDLVELSSDDSFPASDPPGYY